MPTMVAASHIPTALKARRTLYGVYVITPEFTSSDRGAFSSVIQKTEKIMASGVAALQLRYKGRDPGVRDAFAQSCQELCYRYDALFIVNDDPQFAAQIGADGVHLGEHDPDYSAAREILGENAIIGLSCYNCLQRGLVASAKGADYIAFGAFYPSTTKPGATLADIALLRKARSRLDVPLVAIGGITAGNARALIQAGASMVAVSSTLYATDDPADQAQSLQRLFSAETP